MLTCPPKYCKRPLNSYDSYALERKTLPLSYGIEVSIKGGLKL